MPKLIHFFSIFLVIPCTLEKIFKGADLDSKGKRNWGFEGNLELNRYGKHQAADLGTELRKFLGADTSDDIYYDKIMSRNFKPDESRFYTSSINRAQETLQIALTHFFAPQDYHGDDYGIWWLYNSRSPGIRDYNPTPYTIDDPMLAIGSTGCSKIRESIKFLPFVIKKLVREQILNDRIPELQENVTKHKALLDLMSNNIGWDATLSEACTFAENLFMMEYRGWYESDYPEWIRKAKVEGYKSQEDLIRAYKAIFSNAPHIACANYGPCQKAMSGLWLNHILETIDNVKTGKNSLKMHANSTLSLMKAMFMEKNQLNTSGGFIIEVRDFPRWSIRLLNHDPVIKSTNEFFWHQIYRGNYTGEMAKLADDQGWVKLDDFVRLVKPNSFKNWRGECGGTSGEEGQCSPTETTPSSSEKTPTKNPLTSTTLSPTIAPGLPALSSEYCNFLCPNSKKNPGQTCGQPGQANGTSSTKPSDALLENFLSGKIDTIKALLNSLLPLFKSSGKDPGSLESVIDGLNKLFDSLLKGLLSGLNGDLDPLKKLSTALNKLLADLPKVELIEPEDEASLPRTLLEPTRRRRQAIQLLGLEGLIANVLKLVKQLVNDLLPALQKLLKDIGPDLLQLLDKLLGSLRELLDKVLTGLILALSGNSSFLSAISGGLQLMGALGK
uniref:Uncharacterized protein n=1 Tax=Acrobeloides nanus TaxID=290746 RepID=A0A914E073_9BILA